MLNLFQQPIRKACVMQSTCRILLGIPEIIIIFYTLDTLLQNEIKTSYLTQNQS